MELKQLIYFIEVAEREHMSEAAQNLNVAQSALSRQISNLEGELGVELFERASRSLKLLPIGQTVLKEARDIMHQVDHLKKQVDDYKKPESGIVKVGFPTSLATTLLPHLVRTFNENYPTVQFHLRQGSYQFLVDAVKSRELNLAFMGPVITDDPAIKGDRLFYEKMLLLVPRHHRLAGKTSVKMAELQQENFILFPKGYILEKLVIDACRREGFDPHVSTEGEDMDAVKGMVAAGIGVTLLPDSAITQHESSFLTCIPVSDPHVGRSVGMITPTTRQLTPSEQLFYDYVLSQFDEARY
ncbi:LysR family transcriptional regulator [Alkalibacterium pelagium]|uniref:LysR family transcriptional regulator, transcription activator of glutamate synthase operon n=1 Tax=Alkalibacterium pelagium TaxID=426702 RepID=A0A1H7IB79_9LACT|nr:LysR family transcriptional regulator [Alkalibacterium pelagium]GEN50025.1 HTH-type transcriptional regulator GltC [Alkalibacterium pelagium]SEK59698.1 LysR family transcriptional regulator, transcription activator of glutamate synthase operon [Alkalibacterium pelagium]